MPIQQLKHSICSGTFGFKLFGLIFWAAGISSTIGAAYTSVSFFTAFKKNLTPKQTNYTTITFIALALLLYVLLGATQRSTHFCRWF